MKTDNLKREKRKSIRVDTPDSVANCRLLSAETGGRFQFTVWPIKNISTGGVAISSDENITEGALAFLNIDLDIVMRTVSVIAKVVWCREHETSYTIGLNFSRWPKDEDKKLLSDFIKNKTSCEELLYKNEEEGLKTG